MTVRILPILLALWAASQPIAAKADDAEETFRWLSTTDSVLFEGAVWNDLLGDGKDRYKSGGITQTIVIPERAVSAERLFLGYATAFEIQGRAFVATPNDTARVTPTDRPHAQYAGVGIYLRLTGRPDKLTSTATYFTEDRIGLELGWQGDPLPLFDIQDGIHSANGGRTVRTPANTLDPEFLINLEARRTFRIHTDYAGLDWQAAPYVHASLGMRENALRLGNDLIVGSSLEARTWNSDLAVGTLIPGGSRPRSGFQWLAWIGGDVGFIGSDVFLDGGFSGNGPSVDKRPVTLRARAGVMLEWESFAISYSATWLSPEFRTQPQGQIIGAVQIKFDF